MCKHLNFKRCVFGILFKFKNNWLLQQDHIWSKGQRKILGVPERRLTKFSLSVATANKFLFLTDEDFVENIRKMCMHNFFHFCHMFKKIGRLKQTFKDTSTADKHTQEGLKIEHKIDNNHHQQICYRPYKREHMT